MVFRFKQFEVYQKHSAAKVGTDGVLLGAWAPIPADCKHILDVGTGTGLIALMMAQRCAQAKIMAIEIEPKAAQEAHLNFQNSPWSDRLAIQHVDYLQEFISPKFDVIVSNPPFYTETYFSPDTNRQYARQASFLPFQKFLEKSVNLLTPQGLLNVIIPCKEQSSFVSSAADLGLHLQKCVWVKGTPTAVPKRCLLSLGKEKIASQESTLVIEIARHQYTDDYQSLTREFYLKM